MSFPIASEKSRSLREAATRPFARVWPRPVAAPFKHLTALRTHECRYCVQDAPEGEMHYALFCARPTASGPYCEGHARVCRRPNDLDVEALAAELATPKP
jgi:hypothetical protein